MFFYLSKILWFLANPGNILLMMLVVGGALLWTRWYGTARRLLVFCVLAAVFIATVPVGRGLMMALENRFPISHELPEKIDGIIALGGVVNGVVTRSRGQMSIGVGVSRVIELAILSKRYPNAKLVFTGGSGDLLNQNIKEADVIRPLLSLLGIAPNRMIYENRSRNTYENAILTKSLVKPARGENWILITSAFHMPRAVGVFRKAGWHVVPYPAGYSYAADAPLRPIFDLSGGLVTLSAGLHEWLGLIFYRLTGKTDAFFPAPVEPF